MVGINDIITTVPEMYEITEVEKQKARDFIHAQKIAAEASTVTAQTVEITAVPEPANHAWFADGLPT